MSLQPFLIRHLLENSASRYPGKIAVKHKERSITFDDLYEDSLKLMGFLLKEGINKGDRIGILLDKSIEQLVAMFGASMAGAVFVFLNPVLKKKQIEYIINDCQIKLLITTGRLHKKNDLSMPANVLYMDGTGNESSFPLWPKIKGGLKAVHTRIHQVSDDTACLIYTSGSTGLPKGVVVPHRTIVEGAEIVSSYLNITEMDRLISVLPFNFDYGLNQATSSIMQGATLIMHQFFLPKDLFDILEREKITGFAGMNPIWVKILNDKYIPETKDVFPYLRYITNTGGKVPRSIISKMRSFFPNTEIYLMYGLTEAFRSTYLPPDQLDRRPDSMGRAVPNVEILVVDSNGDECEPGEPGELVHRGALITKGYWNNPEKTKKIFRKNPLLKDQAHLNETVVYSRDLVKKDEEEYLYFISRRDDMIKTSGYRVSPNEVEELLIEIPGISDAVVFSKENENSEQIIIAVLEGKKESHDQKAFFAECRKRLPAYMVPGEIYVEKAFAKTANGKIDRSLIKQKWMKQSKIEELEDLGNLGIG